MLASRQKGYDKVEHLHDYIAPIFAKTVLLIRASTGARGPEQNSGRFIVVHSIKLEFHHYEITTYRKRHSRL